MFASDVTVTYSGEVSASGLQHQIMLNSPLPCQSLHVLQCRVLAAVRCVYEQTLQAYSPVCPGKVPREHIHLAPYVGHSLVVWPPVCRLARITRLFFLLLFSVTTHNWGLI